MGFGDTFKALSDPVRREILQLLKDGALSAGEIGAHFDMTGATISYHLKILKSADLIYEERKKNYIYYGLNTSVLENLITWIQDLRDARQYPYDSNNPNGSNDPNDSNDSDGSDGSDGFDDLTDLNV